MCMYLDLVCVNVHMYVLYACMYEIDVCIYICMYICMYVKDRAKHIKRT